MNLTKKKNKLVEDIQKLVDEFTSDTGFIPIVEQSLMFSVGSEDPVTSTVKITRFNLKRGIMELEK